MGGRRVGAARRRFLRSSSACVVLASVLLFGASLLWAVFVPGFRAPDELQHVNSVVRLAEGGGWPGPGDVRIEDETLGALALSGAIAGGPRTVLPGAAAAPPDAQRFADLTPVPVSDRASFHDLDQGPRQGGPIDQMTQHPPGYYAVAGLVYDLAGAGDWRYDRAVFLLRALTALTVAATVPVCCYVAARELSGKESVGRTAAFVPLLIPQLQFVAGAVTNDGATIAATSAAWAILFTITCSGPTRMRLLALAVVVGAACWTKGTALTLLPGIPFAIAIGYRRARGGRVRQWGPPALAAAAGVLGLAFVLGGWWWALNVVRYGRLQPAAYLVPPGTSPTLGVGEFLAVFADRVRWSFFADLGVLKAPSLNWLTIALAILFVVLCSVGLLARHRVADRFLMVLAGGVVTGILFASAYRAHLESHNLAGLQGRYLFVLVVPLAVCFAAGLGRVAGALGRPHRWHPLCLFVGGLVVTVWGLAFGFRLYYAAGDDSWAAAVDRFLGWSAWPLPAVIGLVSAFAAVAGTTAWVLSAGAGRSTPVGPV
ncbi:MAG: hypothetical protein JWQ45_3119 [Blastococcus sp.]|nr:hypothetical protein [Blastococcus sp.]